LTGEIRMDVVALAGVRDRERTERRRSTDSLAVLA
jgi:hypothetical protein